MAEVTIRVAHPSERGKLEALQRRASLGNAEDREFLLANPDAISLPEPQLQAGGVFVAEFQGVVVGFAAVLPRGDGESELDGLFVEPDQQKKGIGRVLVEFSIEFARSQGSRMLHVVGNSHAENFYRSCGFEEVGLVETRFRPAKTFRLVL